MNQTQQQVIALAGLFQAMEAVDHIAQTGRCNEAVLETSINGLFVENPDNALSVYGQLADIKLSWKEDTAMVVVMAANGYPGPYVKGTEIKMLEEAKTTLDDYDAYASALKFNQLLWTIIQADVVDKENKLPPQIKANILSLSIFVDRQTIKALADTKEQHLSVLVNINKNLAEGLMARPDDPQVKPTAPLTGTTETTSDISA